MSRASRERLQSIDQVAALVHTHIDRWCNMSKDHRIGITPPPEVEIYKIIIFVDSN